MAFWRSPLSELEPALKALARGEYEVAFALLESAAQRPRRGEVQAIYRLHLAALYALYGQDGLENGVLELRAAARADPTVVQQSLYQALYWEFAAYRGDPVAEVKRGLKGVSALEDSVAGYHAACALLAVGAPKSAARMLEKVDAATLPTHLDWRRWSRLGQAHQRLGAFNRAVMAYRSAVARSAGVEREAERLNLASCQLELGDAEGALATLAEVDDRLLSENEDCAIKRYLLGRVHVDQGNPNLALEHLRAGHLVEGVSDMTAFSLAYVTGQALTALSRYDEAVEVFGRAIELSDGESRTVALHEQAFALIETERFEEARDILEEVLSDPGYAHRADGFVDLADVLFKLGEFEQAEKVAMRALDLGAVAAACFCLGNIAFEYFRLEEAAAWYEKAASAGPKGSLDWVAAQQMLADVFAQFGPSAAERLLRHAEAAIEHTDPSSDWHLTLTRYIEMARARLGGGSRLLN